MAANGSLRDRLRRWRRSVDFTLARRFGLATRADRTFFLLIGVVGVLAGVMGVVIHELVDGIQRLLWGTADLVAAVGSLRQAGEEGAWWWWLVVVGTPAAGGLLVGLLFLATRGVGKRGGMSLLIESVLLHGGRIPPGPIAANGLASVLTVGVGGSLGREGPMIRLGAMVSTWLAARLGVAPHRVKILLGCGAAAGLAAAYNVPIGGALFAMEVILGNFALEIFGPIVASSVISTFLARTLSGDVRRFEALGYQMVSGWEILTYAGLGLVGALASVAFILGLRWARRGFDRLPLVPGWLKPALGMGLLGGLALAAPQVLSSGHDTLEAALDGRLAFEVLLLLAAGKLLATALTKGSGNAGGLFTPSLFFGGLTGGAFGWAVHSLWPEVTAPYGAYAVVGMGAIAAGTSHAPISAILILFELTGNYDLILPLMVACILASLVSRRILHDSIYTQSLERRGIDTTWRMEEAVLAGMKVSDMVRADPDTLSPAAPYGELVDRFLSAHRQRLFVVGEGRRLLGAVSLHDIKHALTEPERLTMVVAHDLLAPVAHTLDPGERLHRAAEAFAHSDFERLPVVDSDGVYRGVVGKRDLLGVYSQEVLGRSAMLATFVRGGETEQRRDYVELPPDFALRLVPVPERLVGRTLAEARLPQELGARVLEIKRPRAQGFDERVIPSAETELEAGDQLIVLGPQETVDRLARGEEPTRTSGDEAEHLAGID